MSINQLAEHRSTRRDRLLIGLAAAVIASVIALVGAVIVANKTNSNALQIAGDTTAAFDKRTQRDFRHQQQYNAFKSYLAHVNRLAFLEASTDLSVLKKKPTSVPIDQFESQRLELYKLIEADAAAIRLITKGDQYDDAEDLFTRYIAYDGSLVYLLSNCYPARPSTKRACEDYSKAIDQQQQAVEDRLPQVVVLFKRTLGDPNS